MSTVTFVVEEAGCASCAARVRSALEPLGRVESVDVDETADEATVRLAATDASEGDVQAALEGASEDAGHAYRVRGGSWSAA